MHELDQMSVDPYISALLSFGYYMFNDFNQLIECKTMEQRLTGIYFSELMAVMEEESRKYDY